MLVPALQPAASLEGGGGPLPPSYFFTFQFLSKRNTIGQTDQMDQTFGIFEIFEVFEAFEEATMAQMHQNLDSDEENAIFEAFAAFEELHLARMHKIRNSDEDIEVSCGHMYQSCT